jgi:hypothetical protein
MYLFGHNDNLGSLYSFLDIQRSKRIELVWEIQIATTSTRDNIETNDKCSIKTLNINTWSACTEQQFVYGSVHTATSIMR